MRNRYTNVLLRNTQAESGQRQQTREEGAGVMFDEHQEKGINRQALFTDETQDYRRL